MSDFRYEQENIPDEDFVSSVHKKGLPLDVAELMHAEMQETKEEHHNVIFIGTDGDKTIKAIHVPSSAINGGDGPVLFAGANKNLIIAAFSNEFIDAESNSIGEKEPGLRGELWVELMQRLHDMIESEYAENPPVWEEAL